MQISGLSASNTFSATDVLAIEVNVNGVEKTYKLTGATLAAALASIGSYLKTTDVVNNLTSTDPTKVLAAPQGKALKELIAQSTANLIEIRSATCTIASIAANNTIDADCVLSSAFTNDPKNYILISINSTTLMPLVIRSWSDATHFNCRIAQLANAAASNVNLTFRVIGVSVSAT